MSNEPNKKRLSARYLELPLWVRLIVSTLTICLILISTQDLQIFPGATMSLFSLGAPRQSGLPKNVKASFVTTSDNQKLETWRLPGTQKEPVIIIFHGNAGDVENFFPYQQHFNLFGFTTYGFDYRGYGRSTGWPSERGLYNDADAIFEYVLKKEAISANQIIVLGISIGSGPASHLAAKTEPGSLVLLAPFSSLPEAIKSIPFFGILHPFSFYTFPVLENVSKLRNTCLIVAHGKDDEVIPFEQGKEVFAAYQGNGNSTFIAPENGTHNTLLRHSHPKLLEAMFNCFNLESPTKSK